MFKCICKCETLCISVWNKLEHKNVKSSQLDPRCNDMILSGNFYPWKKFTAERMNQIGLERSARWSCSLGDQLTGWGVVLETFSKSSSERVPSECKHCRLTSDIFTKECFTSRQPQYILYSLEVGWRLVVEYHCKVWAEWLQILVRT